jgi:hypothetical protein
MPLNMQQMQEVQQWLAKWLPNGCPICNGGAFKFLEAVELPVPFHSPAGPRLSTNPMRVIPVTCATCSHVLFLSDPPSSGTP